jgi:hypothetical protein
MVGDLRHGNVGIAFFWSDAKMQHMRKASVRDLRYRFSVVEDLLGEGEEVQITKRKRINRAIAARSAFSAAKAA